MGSDTKTIQGLSKFSIILSLAAVIISFIVISGWITNTLILAQFGPHYKPMPLVAALGTLILSLVTLLYLYKPLNFVLRLITSTLLLLVIFFSLMMLVDHYTGMRLNIESWLLFMPHSLGLSAESRVSPFMLISILFIGIALLLFVNMKEVKPVINNIAAKLAFFVVLVAFTNLLGYLYNAPIYIYTGGSQLTTTSLFAAIVSLLLGVSVLCISGVEQFPLSLFYGDSLYTRLMRAIVPIAIILLICQTWINLHLIILKSGHALTVAILSVSFTVIISLMIAKITFKITNEEAELLAKKNIAEEKLNDAVSYNRGLIEASLDPLVTINREGKITDVNKATEHVTGRTRDVLIGTDFSTYFTQPMKAEKGYKEVFNKGFVKDYELTIQSITGIKTDVLYNAVVYRGKHNEVLGVFAAARDVTQRKKAELVTKKYAEDLERSNQELQQFAYIASHDLQEPLRVITSYLQLIERRYKGHLDQDANEFIAFAVNASNKLGQMINDLLTYSRVGTRGNPFVNTDINNTLKQVLSNLSIAIEESKAVITSDKLPTVRCDDTLFVTLFQNLLANAIKFHKPDLQPEIHISAKKQKDFWLFSIADNGIGIDLKYKDKLFIIFKRLVSKDYAGNGIGLAMCRRIVERHKGKIWVESELGKGSIFYFTIPHQGE